MMGAWQRKITGDDNLCMYIKIHIRISSSSLKKYCIIVFWHLQAMF